MRRMARRQAPDSVRTISKWPLLNEQETCRKLQNQMDGMLEIMKNMTAKPQD